MMFFVAVALCLLNTGLGVRSETNTTICAEPSGQVILDVCFVKLIT